MTTNLITIFVCSDVEEAWFGSLHEDNEREWAAHQAEEDQRTEEQLARQHVLGESDCPWPAYADEAFEVCQPEVIEL